MSISPLNARQADPDTEKRRARLVLAIAAVGIAATLLAYAISPGVRHAVSHAAHSVKRVVVHALDHDDDKTKTPAKAAQTPSEAAAAKKQAQHANQLAHRRSAHAVKRAPPKAQ